MAVHSFAAVLLVLLGAAVAGANPAEPAVNNAPAASARPLLPEERILFRSVEGSGYSHHAQLTSLGGTLFATWSSGLTGEDMPGQRMVLSTSTDGGKTWSAPRTLVAPADPSVECITAEGILVRGDTLVAYYGSYRYTPFGLENRGKPGGLQGKRGPGPRWHSDTYCGIVVSRDRGATWSAPVARIPAIVPNLSPVVLKSGRLLLPGNFSFRYSDDPSGTAGWKWSGLPRTDPAEPDDSEGLWYAGRLRGDKVAFLEASVIELDDGRLRAFFRSELKQLGVAESADGGQTWSEPRLTDFKDAGSRNHFGRLPDGRFFALTTPVPGSKRTPLVLALSRDGAVFDRHFTLGREPDTGPRVKGLHKGGRYGYPWLHVLGDTVHVIYSVHKEDVAVMSFPLSALAP